jgi:hypothetical protein
MSFLKFDDISEEKSVVSQFFLWMLAKRGDIAPPNFMDLSDESGFAIALCKEDAAKINAR